MSARDARSSGARDATSGRLLAAIAGGAALAMIAYAAQRVVERAFFPEPNPAVLIWSDRSAFVWRALFSIYFGGLGTFGAYLLAGRREGAELRWLPALIGAALLALLVQTGLAP